MDLKEVIISDADASITLTLWASFSASNVMVGDTLKVSSAKISLFGQKLQAQTTRDSEIEASCVVHRHCGCPTFTRYFVYSSVTHLNNYQ